MSTILIIGAIITTLIWFARGDEYTRRGICWLFIGATVLFIIWFFADPHALASLKP